MEIKETCNTLDPKEKVNGQWSTDISQQIYKATYENGGRIRTGDSNWSWSPRLLGLLDCNGNLFRLDENSNNSSPQALCNAQERRFPEKFQALLNIRERPSPICYTWTHDYNDEYAHLYWSFDQISDDSDLFRAEFRGNPDMITQSRRQECD